MSGGRNNDAVFPDHLSREQITDDDQQRRNRHHDRTVYQARKKGRLARTAGDGPWMNPFTGHRARAWKTGWDETDG
mgnify:CR=1 FL=1